MSNTGNRRNRLVAGLVVLFGALSIAATQAPPGCRVIDARDPENVEFVCRTETWFAPAQERLGNLAALDLDEFPTWDTTPPVDPLSPTNGSAYATAAYGDGTLDEHDPTTGATFEGSFTGNLDNAAITLYLINPARDQNQFPYRGPFSAKIRFDLDGATVYETEAAFDDVNLTPDTPTLHGIRRIDFAITGLYDRLLESGAIGPDAEHALRVTVTPGLDLGCCDSLFLYDASDAPSGIVFNADAAELTGYTLFASA